MLLLLLLLVVLLLLLLLLLCTWEQIERLDVVVAEHRSDKQALRREVKTLRSELRTATEDATALRTDAVHLRRQLEELQLEHDRTTQRAAALEDEVATLPMLRQQLQSAADLEADLNTTAKELEVRRGGCLCSVPVPCQAHLTHPTWSSNAEQTSPPRKRRGKWLKTAPRT